MKILTSLWLEPRIFFAFLGLEEKLFYRSKETDVLFSFVPRVVPMIRSHKWEWGPPTPQHRPAPQCPHYTMHLQTPLTLRSLTAPSQLTSLLRSPYKIAATPWTTGKLQILCFLFFLMFLASWKKCLLLIPKTKVDLRWAF